MCPRPTADPAADPARTRCLITGGAGFLGINLARLLCSRGVFVRSLDIARFDHDAPAGVDAILGDIRDAQAVAHAMRDVDVVVHCAAALPLASDAEIRSTDVGGTEVLLASALRHGIARFVFISSTAVYGIPDHHPVREDDALKGVGPYGRAKIDAERLCLDYRARGLCVTILRPKTFVGPERLGAFELLYDWAFEGRNFPVLGRGDNPYQLLDVADLCEVIGLCMSLAPDRVNDTVNVGAKSFGTMRDNFQAVLDRAGHGKRVIALPARPTVLALRLLERIGLSPLYSWIYETADRDSQVSIERLQQRLGYTPAHSNREALVRNYEWYVAHRAEFRGRSGITHRVPWKHGVLGLAKWFFSLLLVIALAPMATPAMATPAKATATAEQPPAATGIVGLQDLRRSERLPLRDASGRVGSLSLTNLNPGVNAWLLLTLAAPGGAAAQTFHLENPEPARQRVTLDPDAPGGLRIAAADGHHRCLLWPGDALIEARRAPLAYAPLCDGRLYLRNAVRGNRSALEATTEFLRDHVWRGEQIVGFVRRELYRDAFIERGQPAAAPPAGLAAPRAGPPPARLRESGTAPAVVPDGLAIDVGPRAHGLALGRWTPATGVDGVFVGVLQPAAVGTASQLDPVEAQALAYLVAFDLAAFDLGFALGTEHPRLGWSARVPPERRLPQGPGPDGFDSAAPLVRTGMLGPALQSRAVATFTGGFKREHGAFRSGALATVNRGSHYGFVEQGVVFSRLMPGLATLFVLDDGSVDMKTWDGADDALLPRMRHARQNGVPLLERAASGGAGTIGPLVGQWGPGNWSGSADESLRTLRAGACLLVDGGRRFLVYGYFSSATPRAMAQVFQACGCRYAMHLDMNALEHTYLALYRRDGARIGIEHLVEGMAVLDRQVGDALVPRFLGFADDRDFFYLLRKTGP